MTSESDGYVFDSVIHGLNKPKTRFQLTTGRRVELIRVHFVPGPGPAFKNKEYLAATKRIVDDLPAGSGPTQFVMSEGMPANPCYLCVAEFYSDWAAKKSRGSELEYSFLTVAQWVENIDRPIRNVLSQMLANVNWESCAQSDFLI